MKLSLENALKYLLQWFKLHFPKSHITLINKKLLYIILHETYNEEANSRFWIIGTELCMDWNSGDEDPNSEKNQDTNYTESAAESFIKYPMITKTFTKWICFILMYSLKSLI